LLQKYMASRIIKQSSKIKAAFTFFDFSISYDVFSTPMFIFKQRLPELLKILDAVVYAFKNTYSELRSKTLNSLFFLQNVVLFFNSELLG